VTLLNPMTLLSPYIRHWEPPVTSHLGDKPSRRQTSRR